MLIKSKTFITCVIITLPLLFTMQAKAQYTGMKAVYSRMDSQLQSQQMNMMNRMMNFGQFKRSQNSSRILGEFNKYSYHVKMKDGTVKTVKSYIYIDTTLHKDYLLFIDKSASKLDTADREQKIYADKTLSIDRIIDVIDNSDDSPQKNTIEQYFTGMATDSCWLFKIQPGPITLYSFVSEKGNSQLFDPSTIVAIQYNDGSVSQLDLAILKAFILADEKAMKYFDKKDYYSAIKRFDKDSAKGK